MLFSWRSTVVTFHSQQSFSVSLFHVSLGLIAPPPTHTHTASNQSVITCCSDCTTRSLHLFKPAKPSLSQTEVLKLKLCQQLAWPYHGHILWLGTADLSDHGHIIALQALQVHLGQWPSLTAYALIHAFNVQILVGLELNFVCIF